MHTPAILFVDDEVVVRRVVGDALTQTGYRVFLAEDGQSARHHLSKQSIDLVLLDLHLGDANGVEIMRELHQSNPNLPVIILTAHGSLPSAIEAVRHDAADYLLKPVSLDELRRRVANVLQRSLSRQVRERRIRAMYSQLQELFHDEGMTEQHESVAAKSIVITEEDQQGYIAGPLAINIPQHIVTMHGQAIDVTPTEFMILIELARKPDVVVTCSELVRASQNISVDEDEARQIIRPHIARLRRKIEEDPQRPCFIQSVRGIGYRWGDATSQP